MSCSHLGSHLFYVVPSVPSVVPRKMEPAPVNPYGPDQDVMSVNQDTGELNVSGHVVLDVIIINATRMEDAPESLFIGQVTNVTIVEKGTGDLNVIRYVAEAVLMYVTWKENVPVRLVTGQDRHIYH